MLLRRSVLFNFLALAALQIRKCLAYYSSVALRGVNGVALCRRQRSPSATVEPTHEMSAPALPANVRSCERQDGSPDGRGLVLAKCFNALS